MATMHALECAVLHALECAVLHALEFAVLLLYCDMSALAVYIGELCSLLSVCTR